MCKIKEILIEQKKHIRFGEWSANDVRWLFFFYFYFQEAMCKIKELLVDEKRHIRFGDWKDKEVNNVCYTNRMTFEVLRRIIFLPTTQFQKWKLWVQIHFYVLQDDDEEELFSLYNLNCSSWVQDKFA